MSRSDEWIPSGPEPEPILIFEAKWGHDENQLGFYKASGKEDDNFNLGFESFFVMGDEVFIADPVKRYIFLFKNNKVIHTYDYSMRQDEGLIATDDYVFILDSRGYIRKINIKTEEVDQIKQVIKEPYDVVPHFRYLFYKVNNNFAAILDPFNETKCFSTDFSSIECPHVPKSVSADGFYFFLPNGYFVSLEKFKTFWLYNQKGKRIGVVKGAFSTDYLYDMRSYQCSIDGIYYVTQSKEGAKIYLKKWQR